jgi:hypothetical protein
MFIRVMERVFSIPLAPALEFGPEADTARALLIAEVRRCGVPHFNIHLEHERDALNNPTGNGKGKYKISPLQGEYLHRILLNFNLSVLYEEGSIELEAMKILFALMDITNTSLHHDKPAPGEPKGLYLDGDEFDDYGRQLLRLWAAIGNSNATAYMHDMADHVGDMLRFHGSIHQFSTQRGELVHKTGNGRTLDHVFNATANPMEALIEVGQHSTRQLAHVRYCFTRILQGHDSAAAEELEGKTGTKWDRLRPDTLTILGPAFRDRITFIDQKLMEQRRREEEEATDKALEDDTPVSKRRAPAKPRKAPAPAPAPAPASAPSLAPSRQSARLQAMSPARMEEVYGDDSDDDDDDDDDVPVHRQKRSRR